LEALEAAGSGSNLGFNYSHLEKQDINHQKIILAACQLGLTGEAQPILSPNPRKTTIQLLLEAQQHKKYAQTTPLDDGVSSLFKFRFICWSDYLY
jgi:hypothetical protein